METKLRYEVGTKIGGYRIERVEPLEHLKGTYVELRHEPTGARHIHIEAPDESKAFVVDFPTVPKDSRGVAHILEHVVLAGSQRYPVRDPFFSMISRSVRDFMNAMTFYDSTAYPFATRNEQDFYNLLDIYLDAAFFPLITESAFQQEGHRLEFEETGDPGSGLRIKGVVFNEMKGNMATPAYVASRAIGRALFPGSTYANNSGGDPQHIPDLTWQDLKDFHARHYHPSNAMFYTYGDLPLSDVLSKIEDAVLSRFEAIDPDTGIDDQPRFTEPVELVEPYPLSRDEDPKRKSQVIVSWLTGKVSDSFESLALQVLSEVLLANAASPLRKALIDSGLGDGLADGSGYRDNYKEAVFGAGLKGADAEDAESIEKIVLDTLARLADEGVDREQVEAAVHQFELHTREVSNAGFPYAVKVWFQLKFAYIYGGDPHRSLQLDADFERLRKEMEAGPFFEDLIRRFLLDNPHRARIVVVPDQDLEERERQEELDRVAQVEAGLSEEDKQRIVTETLALKAEQEAKQDVSVLPFLEPTEISLEPEDVEVRVGTVRGATVGFAPQPTNGLSYVVIAADASGLPDHLIGRLGLFSRALSRSGAGEHDYLRQALRIDRYTGGIEASIQPKTTPGGDRHRHRLIVTGKALSRNDEPFVEILRDILAAPAFEPQRLREIVAELRAMLENYLIMVGQQYARILALSRLTPGGAFLERTSGITSYRELKRLLERSDGLDDVVADLTAIAEHLFRAGNLEVCVTADDEVLGGLEGLVGDMLGALPADAKPPAQPAVPAGAERFPARTNSAPVSYNAKALRTVPFTDPDQPALFVLGHYLRRKFLHGEIREKGGAYGSYAGADAEEGTFSFWSYRDPHVVRTFEVFDRSADHVIDEDIEAQDVKEAILQALSEVDPLLSPDTRGRRRFFDDLAGYTTELRLDFKQRLLRVTAEDLKRVAATHLKADGAVRAYVGNAQKIEEANEQMDGAFDIEPV